MTFSFNQQNLIVAKEVIAKYPKERFKSAIMPLLTLAQKQNDNYLSQEAMDYVAKFLNVNPIEVYEVANFYTMYNTKPVGKYHIQVCKNISCYLRGSHDVIKELQNKLQIKTGETTKDNLFTLTEVECLAACEGAPAIQINDNYIENVGTEHVDKIINKLKLDEVVEGSMTNHKS